MILRQFTRQYTGSSFPALVETTDGQTFVLKMRGSGNGPLSLISEFIANRVAARIGWPVPDVAWIEIPQDFPWTFGTDEFDDIVQKSYGWNLGIAYISEAVPMGLPQIDVADTVLLNRIYTLDLFFINVDRTEKACNLLRDNTGKTWIIDHGALGLFQGVRGDNRLFGNHLLLGLKGAPAFSFQTQLLRPDLFEAAIGDIPAPLLADAGVTPDQLMERVKIRTADFITV